MTYNNSNSTGKIRPRLLGVFAHPDDETFGCGGTLAKYVREGVDVHVCIATDGASGSYEPDVVRAEEVARLAAMRREELECAVQTLGVHLHMLNYRDSGMEGTSDNGHPSSLYQADLDTVVCDIVQLIRTVRPHVVISHDPTGGYFHPDHIKVNKAVTLAFHQAADPDICLSKAADHAPWQPARLYYTARPRSQYRWQILTMRLQGKDPRHAGRNRDVDLTRLGVPDSSIHVRLDVTPYLAIKERAAACHRSQGGDKRRQGLFSFLQRRLTRYENFIQAYPSGARPHQDLFEGLNVAEAEQKRVAVSEPQEKVAAANTVQ